MGSSGERCVEFNHVMEISADKYPFQGTIDSHREWIRLILVINILYYELVKCMQSLLIHNYIYYIINLVYPLTRLGTTLRKGFVMLHLYWWLFSSTKHCS